MIKICFKFKSFWKECTLTTEGRLSFTQDGVPLSVGPDEPMDLDVFFINKTQVTRNFDAGIPRWADASEWSRARTLITLLREWGYMK